MVCEKTAYTSGRNARREARKISDQTGDEFRAYACPDCGQWHLSTRPNFKNRSIPRGSVIAKGRRPKPGETIEQLAERMRRER